MKNLTVENIYTRQAAKILTRKNFWRMLGMMLLTGVIFAVLFYGGTYLLAMATDAPWIAAELTYTSSSSLDPDAMMSPAFIIGYIVLMLVVSLLGTGLNLGLIRATTDIARGEEKVPVRRIFSRMKYFLKGWGLGLWVGFKVFLWVLPVFAITGFLGFGIAVAGDPQAAQLNETTAAIMTFLPLAMMILIFALVIPAALRYSQAPYVLADEPSTGVFECVRKSKAMMKGHKWQLFKLTIPYLLKMYGWLLLIAVILAVVMGVTQSVQSEAAGIISIVVAVAAYVLMLVKMVTYMLRCQVAYSLFYLKRKGELPAVPPEEEERIVAWQPAAEKTAPESVATDAANIGCWNPGGEIKSDKE